MTTGNETKSGGNSEMRLRTQLAACVRLLHQEDLIGYNGHASARVPGTDTFLIHSIVESRAEVSPESLLLLDFDGNVLEGKDGLRPPSELYIHSEIFRARPDVMAVGHTHSEAAIAFTMAKGVTLKLMRCDAVRWASGIPTHADPSRIRCPQQGRELAETLGDNGAALLRAHGAVLATDSVPSLLAASVQLEENARTQLMAAQLGQPDPLSEAELDALRESSPPEFLAHYASKIWSYYVPKGVSAGIIPVDWPEIMA